jgi:DNA uptake protein ComE-like DNA-binding protein
MEHFKLDSIPVIKKQNINSLTIAQLTQNYYVNTSLASKIVAVRTQKEHLTSWKDLIAIQQLDSVKKARLSLYLSFE